MLPTRSSHSSVMNHVIWSNLYSPYPHRGHPFIKTPNIRSIGVGEIRVHQREYRSRCCVHCVQWCITWPRFSQVGRTKEHGTHGGCGYSCRTRGTRLEKGSGWLVCVKDRSWRRDRRRLWNTVQRGRDCA